MHRGRPRGVRGADALAFDGGDPRLRRRRRREGGRGAWRRRRAYRFRRARAALRGDRERGGVLMPLSEALEKWHDFYLLLGTGAAALVALLFVAVSLGAGFLNEERAEATRTFFSPVVVHFSAVFFLACIALVPGHRAAFFAVLMAAAGVFGLCVAAYATV